MPLSMKYGLRETTQEFVFVQIEGKF